MATMSKGCCISNKNMAIVVETNSLHLIYDEENKTKNSYICGIILGVKLDNCCFATITTASKQDINDLHKKLGHVSKLIVHETAKFYNWPITYMLNNVKSPSSPLIQSNRLP